MDYVWAAVTGAFVSLAFNYKTISRLVFGDDGGLIKFSKFSLVFGLSLVLNIFGIRLVSDAGFSKYVAAALVAGPIAIITYLLNAKVVFRAKQEENGSSTRPKHDR
jgi:putative flippase GtrA